MFSSSKGFWLSGTCFLRLLSLGQAKLQEAGPATRCLSVSSRIRTSIMLFNFGPCPVESQMLDIFCPHPAVNNSQIDARTIRKWILHARSSVFLVAMQEGLLFLQEMAVDEDEGADKKSEASTAPAGRESRPLRMLSALQGSM